MWHSIGISVVISLHNRLSSTKLVCDYSVSCLKEVHVYNIGQTDDGFFTGIFNNAIQKHNIPRSRGRGGGGGGGGEGSARGDK